MALLIATPHAASSEWFVDFYAREGLTERADVTTNVRDLGLRTTVQDVKFDHGITFGGRAGYWLASAPVFGIGVDAFRFRPNISRQTRDTKVCSDSCVSSSAEFQDLDLSVIAASVDIMFRAAGMLESDDIPQGRLQPYITIGPTVFIAEAKDSTNFGPPADQSDTHVSVGFKVGGGFAWQFHRHAALFAEYRFTYLRPRFEFTSSGLKTTVDTRLDTHHAVGGVSFRF